MICTETGQFLNQHNKKIVDIIIMYSVKKNPAEKRAKRNAVYIHVGYLSDLPLMQWFKHSTISRRYHSIF